MANTIDIFNSKLQIDKLVGGNNFFNNTKELTEFNKLQQKYVSNVDYSKPANFAKFGSAEEYYKNAINYINSNYPYDGSTDTKLSWINALNELEYHIFNLEYPRSLGYVDISGSQFIEIYSHVREPVSGTKNAYDANSKYTVNTTLNLNSGFTYEGWFKFSDNLEVNLLSVNALSSSGTSLTEVNVVRLLKEVGPDSVFSVTDNVNTYSFDKIIINNEWHHYAFHISNDSISLYIDGTINQTIDEINLQTTFTNFVFAPLGLFIASIPNITIDPNTNRSSVFEIGGGGLASFDDIRLWNGKRSVEKIGRYWFTHVDGNDFHDPSNSNLLFYYKFNEGWDDTYGFLCLDYSGRQNDGEIINYEISCRDIGSAIDECGFVQDKEEKDIIFKGLSYSTNTKNYYNTYVEIGIQHDEQNMHMLYNKFPMWVLQDEESNQVKHLKQLIQIISSYFDDLYNKIGEITNYKKIRLNDKLENVYPFYDKILTSNGFNVTDLFSNLDIVEKISSRNDTTLFDEDIQKIKNAIFQNIYNNLAFILKSKGTEKSLKSLLAAYGVNDNLVKINLYSDGAEYHVDERLKETIVKKKTVTLSGDNSIFLSSSAIQQNSSSYYFSLETSVAFQEYNTPTASVFGMQNNTDANDLSWATNVSHYYVTVENSQYGTKFVLRDHLTNVASSSYIKDFYDDTVWNLVMRKKPNVDTVFGSVSPLSYTVELYGVNKNRHFEQEFSCSIPYLNDDGYLRYYIGARKSDLTGSTIYEANSKFLYCNFWNNYLNSETIVSHNKDILNYGSGE